MSLVTDYLLYDNRTWSARSGKGKDWSIKVASGALGGDRGLQQLFSVYYTATTRQGIPRRFGAALGGLRPRSELSTTTYLLCVSLETTDQGGRPSWAVIGFSCRTPHDLRNALLESDLVASAREILEADAKPAAATLLLRASAGPLAGSPHHPSPAPYGPPAVLERFDAGESISRASEILLRSAIEGVTLPSILGIAAFKRFDPGHYQGFDLAFCHPVDEAGESALRRALEKQRTRPPISRVPPAGDAPQAREGFARPAGFPPAAGSSTVTTQAAARLLPLLIAAALLIGAILAFQRAWFAPQPAADGGTPADAPTSDAAAISPTSAAPHSATGDTAGAEIGSIPRDHPTALPQEGAGAGDARSLDRFTQMVSRFDALRPDELRATRAFRLAETVAVAAPFQEQRRLVQLTFERLLVARNLVSGSVGDSVSYYIRGSGGSLTEGDRLSGIQRVLGQARAEVPSCEPLREAFGFEFEDERSELGRWCAAAEDLAAVAMEGL